MTKDLTVSLPDRPGELARLAETLANAGVNIEGVSGTVHEDRGVVHLLVGDVPAARAALASAGIEVEAEAEVVVAGGEGDQDTPGALARMARAVADAGVDLRFVYEASHGRIVFGADDVAEARRVLGS